MVTVSNDDIAAHLVKALTGADLITMADWARDGNTLASHEAKKIGQLLAPVVRQLLDDELDGIDYCGDRLAMTGCVESICGLRAGHGGWHRSDQGTEWTRNNGVTSAANIHIDEP